MTVVHKGSVLEQIEEETEGDWQTQVHLETHMHPFNSFYLELPG